MCNLYRMDTKDWINKWVQDAESFVNLMPAYQMNPDQMGPIVRNTGTVESNSFMPDGACRLRSL